MYVLALLKEAFLHTFLYLIQEIQLKQILIWYRSFNQLQMHYIKRNKHLGVLPRVL